MSELAVRIRSRRRIVLGVGIPASLLLSIMVAVPQGSPSWLRSTAFALGTLGLIGFAISFFRVLQDVNAVRDHWASELGPDWFEQRGQMSRDGMFDANGWYGLFGLASFSGHVDDYVRETARSYLALGAFLLCPAIVFVAATLIRSLLLRS